MLAEDAGMAAAAGADARSRDQKLYCFGESFVVDIVFHFQNALCFDIIRRVKGVDRFLLHFRILRIDLQ